MHITRHLFASSIADGANPALVLPSDWNTALMDAEELTNRTGVSLAAGDVVGLSTANSESVILADSVGTPQPLVVALGTISGRTIGSTANLSTGFFAKDGVVTVKNQGAVTRGNWLRKSATTLAAEDTGIPAAGIRSIPSGSFAVALGSNAGSGTVPALMVGSTWPRTVKYVNNAARGGLYQSQGANGASLSGATFNVDDGATQHFVFDLYDALSNISAGAWGNGTLGLSVYHRKTGGSGNRGAFDARVDVSGGTNVNDFYVAGGFFALAGAGTTGKYFGLNPYALIGSTALTTCEAVSIEADVDVRNANVIRKVGVQISDVATSTGTGSVIDNGLRFENQVGAAKWLYGIYFDDSALRTGGAGIHFEAQTTNYGIDMSALTIALAAINLGQGHKVQWTSGFIRSDATASGPAVIMADNQVIAFQNLAASEHGRMSRTGNGMVLQFVETGADPAAPSANTGVIYMRDNGAGKTQLVARFPTGAIQVIATEP